MANPVEIAGRPAVLATSGTPDQVKLDPDRSYLVGHSGKQEGGGNDSADVYLATSAAVDADGSSGADKYVLSDGEFVTLPPGIGLLKFASAGTPTLKIMPGKKLHGEW
jgi:hypothetical protein